MTYKYEHGYKKCEKCGTLWKRNAECPHTDPVVSKEVKSGER